MSDQRWIARLPRDATPPLRVFVNGVPQREGSDYTMRGNELVFSKPLAKEGRLGVWRWTIMLLGIAGSYGRNDSVDVQYDVAGRAKLATGLDVRAEGEAHDTD